MLDKNRDYDQMEEAIYLKTLHSLPDLIQYIVKKEDISQAKLSERLKLGKNTVNTWVSQGAFPNTYNQGNVEPILREMNPLYADTFARICEEHDDENKETAHAYGEYRIPEVKAEYIEEIIEKEKESEWGEEYKKKIAEADTYIPLYRKFLPKGLYDDFEIKQFAEQYYLLIIDESELIFAEKAYGNLVCAAYHLQDPKEASYLKAVQTAQTHEYFQRMVKEYGFDTSFLVSRALFYKKGKLPETAIHACIEAEDKIESIITNRLIEMMSNHQQLSNMSREELKYRADAFLAAVWEIYEGKGLNITLHKEELEEIFKDYYMVEQPNLLSRLKKHIQSQIVPDYGFSEDELKYRESDLERHVKIIDGLTTADLRRCCNVFVTDITKIDSNTYNFSIDLNNDGRDIAEKMEMLDDMMDTEIDEILAQYPPKHHSE